MYLTDYRERCLKDVITQLEPGLFKKVTGLSVIDFNMLCSLGVFNAPLMNDAIFKFKRYEDSSLTYTGINKYSAEEVGGWDTTIRREQYEKLFYNQQASMNGIDYSTYSNDTETVDNTVSENIVDDNGFRVENDSYGENTGLQEMLGDFPVPSPSAAYSKAILDNNELNDILSSLTIDSLVVHKRFGRGHIVRMNKNEKYIYIKFSQGEKKFIFPDAFRERFLEVE